jgi:hypothetical protein
VAHDEHPMLSSGQGDIDSIIRLIMSQILSEALTLRKPMDLPASPSTFSGPPSFLTNETITLISHQP